MKSDYKIIVDVTNTQYDVIKQVITEDMKWKTMTEDNEESDDFDIYWSDLPMQPQKYIELEPYQKHNHFPGTFNICRKNLLAKHLNAMR
jgi:hypothetical protein